MRKLNPRELKKRKAYLSKISKPVKNIKEIKKECTKIAEDAFKKIEELKTQRQKDKAKEILINNLELLKNINTENKERIYNIFKKVKEQLK